MAGRTSDAGDNQNAIAIADLRYAGVVGEGNTTVSDYWQSLVTEIGNASANQKTSSETLNSLVSILKAQEQSLSGVSLDEEAAKLLEFEQMYQACAKYLNAVSEMTETLLQYV